MIKLSFSLLVTPPPVLLSLLLGPAYFLLLSCRCTHNTYCARIMTFRNAPIPSIWVRSTCTRLNAQIPVLPVRGRYFPFCLAGGNSEKPPLACRAAGNEGNNFLTNRGSLTVSHNLHPASWLAGKPGACHTLPHSLPIGEEAVLFTSNTSLWTA